jgi:hypothetical protein
MKNPRKSRKSSKKVVDTKMAQANDKSQTPELKNIIPRLTAEDIIAKAENSPKPQVATGIGYAKMAGSPSKQLVTRVFGKTGYAYSWVKRAEKLDMDPATLCQEFAANPDAVKVKWEKATTKS